MSAIILRRLAALTFLALATACAPAGGLQKAQFPDQRGGAVLPPLQSDTQDVNGFAAQVLNSLQPRSIAESREYCGLIMRAEGGGLVTSRINPGTEDSCEMPRVIGDVVATFHTHGSFSPAYDNEVPSMSDVAGDFSQRIDGYVSTPGGRLWHVDFETRRIYLLCGPGCLRSDPNNEPKDAGFVPQSFTVPQLRARFT